MSMQLPYLLILVVAIGVWLFRRGARTRRPQAQSKIERLRARYRQLVRLPRAEADAALERHITALEARFPGRAMEWYVERVIKDLVSDRR